MSNTHIQEYRGQEINYTSDDGTKISNVSADGLSLITDALTTPIQTIISGSGFDTGGAIVSFSNLYNLKQATPALRIPLTTNVFLLENTIQVEDETTLPTRMASLGAPASVNPQLTLKADTGGAVWEEADLTQNGLSYTDSGGNTTSSNWASIIAGVALRPLFYSSGLIPYSIASGSWINIAGVSSPIYTFSGLTPSQTYNMSISLSIYCDVYESSSAMYIDFVNGIGTYGTQIYSSSHPVATIGSSSTFPSVSTSQFVLNDYVNFTADGSGLIAMNLYLGHNGGSWGGICYWTMTANILSP